MKFNFFQYKFLSFLLLLCNLTVYGKGETRAEVYEILSEYLRQGNYKDALIKNNTLEHYQQDTILTNLITTIKDCGSLKNIADSLYNNSKTFTEEAYRKYMELCKKNPADPLAQKRICEYELQLSRNELEANHQGKLKEWIEKWQNDSIRWQNDTIRLVDTINQKANCITQLIIKNQQLEKVLDDTTNLLISRIGSLKKSKWDKARQDQFYSLIKDEYDEFSRREKDTHLFYIASDSLVEEKINSTFAKIDSALAVLDREKLDGGKKITADNTYAYLLIFKALLCEFKYDFEEAEKNYKIIKDSIDSPYCPVPLITYYFRYKNDGKAMELYKDWDKKIKENKNIDNDSWGYRLKILSSLTKFNKKFLSPFEKKNTPYATKRDAYYISGLLLAKSSDYKGAKKYFRNAYSDTISDKDILYKAMLFYYLGKSIEKGNEIQKQQKPFDEAKNYYNQALDILNKDTLNFKPIKIMIYNSLGELLLDKKLGDYVKADTCFKEAKRIYMQLKDTEPQSYSPYTCDSLAIFCNNLGKAQSLNSKYADADSSFAESLRYYRQFISSNPEAGKEEAKVLINLAINYYEKNKPGKDKPLKNKNIEDRKKIEEMEEMIRKALRILFECKVTYGDEYVKNALRLLDYSVGHGLDENSYKEGVFDKFGASGYNNSEINKGSYKLM